MNQLLAISCASLLSSWAATVLLVGRAMPWQASRIWILVFGVALVAAGLWWWHYWRAIARTAGRSRRRVAAAVWGAGPFAVVAVLFLAAAYIWDGFYGVLMAPFFRMQFLAGAAVLAALLESLQAALLAWLRDDRLTFTAALLRTVQRRREPAMWLSLVAVGVFQGIARSPAIGDDLGQYTVAARSILDGLPYPVNARAAEYVAVGVTPVDPALPLLPILLASSFAAFGRTLAAVGLAFSALKALYPVVAFVACRALTGSKPLSYAVAILLTLFPIYQVHVLSAPEPDALFAELMLLTVALAAKALATGRWQYWAGMGGAAGLVANTRHEGLEVSVAILLAFLALQRPKKVYAALLAPFLLTLVPFALVSFSTSGLLWPTYSGTISPGNVGSNLQMLRDRSFPWYVQVIGLDTPWLLMLLVVAVVAAGASLILLWRDKRPLVFIPLLGVGYVVASLLVHQRVLNPYSPTDVFRHWNTGIPYVVLSVAYALHAGYRSLTTRLPDAASLAVSLAVLAIVVGITYYECERLARPELYYGGQASLQGGGYMLTDLIRHPVPLPAPDDHRPGEVLRVVQAEPLRAFSLSVTNTPEPYHWTTLIVAMFGLGYAAAPIYWKRPATEDRKAPDVALVSG